MTDVNDTPQNEETGSADDLWAEAFAEQGETAEAPVENTNAFEQLEPSKSIPSSQVGDIDLILDIPVKMTVQLGKTKMAIKDLLSLSQGSVVPLDGLAGEPLDILINGYLIAQGEVVVVDDKYGIRITDIITPSERMRRLSHG
ncbi:flagellar motor switch protein FliN [Thorsellia anophelis]|uniref:Flagellar motor switch protein FliN n=1 Tax=Thorsellia anophelis DSM 18579 TaxID=1123402 RepID=A0A1H9ZT96_9GAMM|nr:flagellar motor switch protein FliN [Thorsellia anophelis]SES84900.1 flagellar motor switch protein FliN/FliY [Thorsellia anophelis DSM 18579]